MSYTVTAGELLERARQLADLPPFTTVSQVTSAAALEMVKASVRGLSALVKRFGDEAYFAQFTTVSTVASNPDVAMPAAMDDLLRVTWQVDSQRQVPLDIANVDDFISYPSGWQQSLPIRYRLVAGNMRLFPTPDAVYTLNLYYAATQSVVSTATNFVGRDQWDDWIANDLCVRFRARQQKDASEFVGERATLADAIVDTIRRDKYQPRQVRNARSYAGPTNLSGRNGYPWLY